MIGKSGQALVTLIVFIAVATTVTSAAVVATLANSQSTTTQALGDETYKIAESGIENAILRLLRDPNYSGETLTVGNGTVIISVTGTSTKTILSQGSINGYKKNITAIGTFSNNSFNVTSWRETN